MGNIKLQNFCDLFPNLKQIFIQNIELSEQFMESLHQFLGSKGSGNLQKHKVDEISIYNIIESVNTDDEQPVISMQDYVQKYWQQFDDINYKVHHQSVYHDFLCFHKEQMCGVADLW